MQKIKPEKTVVIFSHGFGIQKDNLGLFTLISENLKKRGLETVLFDYYEYNKELKEIYTTPFSKQAEILQNEIDKVKVSHSDKDIVLICHSQGCIVPTLCDMNKVIKVVGISPFFITDKQQVYDRYSARDGSITNFDGISKRKHSAGKITVIPPEYWQERFQTNQYDLYNNLAKQTYLKLIYGTNDSLVNSVDMKMFNVDELISMPADHDFNGDIRDSLIDSLP